MPAGALGAQNQNPATIAYERFASFVLITAGIETSQSGHDDNNVNLSKSEFNANSSDAIAVFQNSVDQLDRHTKKDAYNKYLGRQT